MSPLFGAAPARRPFGGAHAPASPAPEPRINILLVDDQPANLLALESMLERPDFNLVRAASGEDALRAMLKETFALVLLDVLMPGLDGFETAALMRKRKQSVDTPVIFLTAGSLDDAHATRGYSLGAVDYIHKPIVSEILKAKVHVFAELWRKTQRLAQSEEHLRLQLDRIREEQEARHDSEEKYRELFTRANDAIVVYDQKGAVLDANLAALKLYGYTRPEIARLKAADLGDDLSKNAGVSIQKRKDGSEFPCESTHGAFSLKGRKLIMALARDITEREKAAEAERMRDRAFMQRRLVSIVSHELRTPITAIKGFAETLRRGGDEDPKNRMGFIRIIEKHAERLGSLVEDLLAVAELESGKSLPRPEALELKGFANDFVVGIATIAARRSVSISLEVEKDLVIWMDPAHLSQVLQNLLENAIKYNRKSGSVMLTARRAKGGLAWISVADTGIGIEAAELPRIFEQFHRTDAARAHSAKGTGLGLYIIKSIIESNGGRIWAESAKDEGSVFHFTVPLADGPRTPKRTAGLLSAS